MSSAFIFSLDQAMSKRLSAELERENIKSMICADLDDITENVLNNKIDIILLHLGSDKIILSDLRSQLSHLRRYKNPIVIILCPPSILSIIVNIKEVDDFVLEPYNMTEFVIRMRKLLNSRGINESREVIYCNDLVINLRNCEVLISGKLVALTYKEYELLKLLASNKGKVYTREALLNEIWGYDYYGGDRTVDVHIRRLRSKIEDSMHNYIDTVRNIGYKFNDGIIPESKN